MSGFLTVMIMVGCKNNETAITQYLEHGQAFNRSFDLMYVTTVRGAKLSNQCRNQNINNNLFQ